MYETPKMRLNPRVLVKSAAVIALTCAVTAAAYFYKSRKTSINEVMVFCKLQFNAHNCFDKLISYVEAAKKNVNVCMPGIQNPAIQGRLVKILMEKKVKLRIVIDRSGYNESSDFFIKELIDAGAEIKCNTNQHKEQHKFCLVDDKVLMTGTLNWGNDRSSDHWNYVYITNKPQLVDPVKSEFNQMWNECVDINSCDFIEPSTEDSGEETDTSAVTEVEAKKFPDPELFRETVSTPEVYII